MDDLRRSKREVDFSEAQAYLESGGLGEVVGLTDIALSMGQPKVQCDAPLAMALCVAADEGIEARKYVRRLLVSFVNEHCDPVPEWKPLDDLMGMLTQLDNALTVVREIKGQF